MAESRSTLDTIDQFISFSLLLPLKACNLSRHQVIASMNYIESAAGDDIAEILQSQPDATIEMMRSKQPLLAGIMESLKGVSAFIPDIETNPEKKNSVRLLFAVFVNHLKADCELAKNTSLSSLFKDLAAIIEYCRKKHSDEFTLEVLNRIVSYEFMSVSASFPEHIGSAVRNVHHFLHVSELTKNKFENYHDDKSDLSNRINRKITELKKKLEEAAKPKLSEEERVRKDFALAVNQPENAAPAVKADQQKTLAAAQIKEDVSKRIEALKDMEVKKTPTPSPAVSAANDKTVTLQDLIDAVSARNAERIKLLAAKKLNINGYSPNGWTALNYAAMKGDNDIVELLLQLGANPNIPMQNGNYPLHYAATIASSNNQEERARGYAIIKLLKAARADLSKANCYSKTVYDICNAQNQFIEEVKSLEIRRVTRFLDMAADFADINRLDSNGWTALCHASMVGNIAMIEHLLAIGANPNMPIRGGSYPVHLAAQLAASNNPQTRENGYAIIKVLKAARADLSKSNAYGKNVYDICNAQNQFMEEVKTLNPAKVRQFLDMTSGFVDINKLDSNGWTALCYATAKGDTVMIDYLLELGANANTPISGGSYPSHFAAQIAASTNLDTRANGYAIIKTLKAARADMLKQNGYGKNVYNICNAQNQFMEEVKTLKIEKVEQFLDMATDFVDINKLDANGWTALAYATAKGDIAMIEYLLKLGAKVNIPISGGSYPIHFAAQIASSNNLDERAKGYAIIKLLKSAGADLYKQNCYGKTILDLCNAQNQFMEEVKTSKPAKVKEFLDMASGFVNVNKMDSSGWTALCYAAGKGNAEMVDYLLQIGASANLPISGGNYPIHLAAQLAASNTLDIRANGYAIIKTLKAAGADIFKQNGYNKYVHEICNAQNQFMDEVKTSKPEKVKQFLNMASAFVDINKICANGHTALTYAISNHDIEMVKYLLCMGASVSISVHGEYPVHFAARLAASANTFENECGYEMLRYLKCAGADLYARNSYSKTAYDIGNLQDHLLKPKPAAALQQNSMFSAKKMSPEDKLYLAVKQGLSGKIKKYMDNGIDCNYIYADTQHKTLVNYLIGETKLGKNELDILDMLIRNAADLSLRDINQNSPMDIICNRMDIPYETREMVMNRLVDSQDNKYRSLIKIYN